MTDISNVTKVSPEFISQLNQNFRAIDAALDLAVGRDVNNDILSGIRDLTITRTFVAGTLTGNLALGDTLTVKWSDVGLARNSAGLIELNSGTLGAYRDLRLGNLNLSALSSLASSTAGIILLRNNAGTDFGRLQFGGTTSSFPALKRSGTALQFRLADDSAYSDVFSQNHVLVGGSVLFSGAAGISAPADGFVRFVNSAGTGFTALQLATGASTVIGWYVGTGSPEGTVTAAVGSTFSRLDGSTSTTLYVKTSGTGNTGWTAK